MRKKVLMSYQNHEATIAIDNDTMDIDDDDDDDAVDVD